MRRPVVYGGMAMLALSLQGCALFGGGTPPCERPQEYQDAEVASPMVAPEGLGTPQAFGNLEIPEGEVLAGEPRRKTGDCLEAPPRIAGPESG